MPETLPVGPSGSGILVAFDGPDSVLAWSAIDDAVMGGLSSSRLVFATEGYADFIGTVSLANNGGFASVRSLPGAYSAPGMLSVRLRVRGDGRRYRLNLRTDDAWDGVSYQAALVPPVGQWGEVVLPIGEFAPRYRGRAVLAPALDPGRIRRLGLMIADRQPGPFRLSIGWLRSEAAALG